MGKVIIENKKDGLTTAERSLINSRNIELILEKIDAVQPTNLEFADGSKVNTQATKAEAIVSTEDIRLAGLIGDLKSESEAADTNLQDQITANVGNIDNLSTAYTDLEGRVNENELDIAGHEARITTNTQIGTNHQARITNLENAQTSSVYDYSLVEDAGSINDTPKVISPTIDLDFKEDLATNILDAASGELTTIPNINALMEVEYYFNAQELTGTSVEVYVALINKTDGTTLDIAKTNLDFTGSNTSGSGTRKLIGSVDADKEYQIQVYTGAGTAATILDAKAYIKIEANQGSRVITDQDVASTNSYGNETIRGDITYLKGLIDDLQTQIKNREVEIGDIEIRSKMPKYGTFEEITIEEGMAILLGGSEGDTSITDGSVKSHSHKIFKDSDTSTSNEFISPSSTGAPSRRLINESDNNYLIRTEGSTANSGDTSSTGTEFNKAWGIKTGLKIWRRTA